MSLDKSTSSSNNSNLSKAKNAKNDEFYTQYHDIEKEMNAYLDYDENVFRDKTIFLPCDDPEWSNFTHYFAQNFKRLGLKKLISTSYAPNSKPYQTDYQPSLFESNNPQFDEDKTIKNGKIFTLTQDTNGDGKIDFDDIEWTYLNGDGDFRSDEIIALRDEADIIITNPPFSLFRDFLGWIVEADKQFVMIGNKNCVTYKEVFPLIKNNKMWSGRTEWSGGMWFKTMNNSDVDKVVDGVNMKNVSSIWVTNLDHGRRHEPLQLMSMADNLKFNKKLKDQSEYLRYDNYDAIEVSFTNAIPNDYEGVMGVPISFLDKYCPEQFEIVGMCENSDLYSLKTIVYSSEECKQAYFNKFGKKGVYDLNASGVLDKDGLLEKVYQRILIKNKDINHGS